MPIQATQPREPTRIGEAPPDGALVDDILGIVRARCGTPFESYRRATMERRIRNRMISARTPTLAAYRELLAADPREASRLLERLTLKVSRFFRNAPSVAALSRAIAARAAVRGRPFTAWSAGCARGEEAYTLAIVLAELGCASARAVLGTDVDPSALADAERGRYRPDALEEVPDDVVHRYFRPSGADGLRSLREQVRAGVSFRHHDLVSAERPPLGRTFDLVACRNVLIYLSPPARSGAQRLLRDALAPGGLLWLGEVEWPDAEIACELEVVDRRARLFRRREARG